MPGHFSACKTEEKSGLTPAADENEAGWEMSREDVCFFVGEQY